MNNLTQNMVATLQISFAIILLFCSTYLSINIINEKQLLHDDSLKQFISISSIIQKTEAQELSEDDDYSLTSEIIDDTEIEDSNDDLEAESLDQVGNDAVIGLPNDIETPFDDLEAESLNQVGNDAVIGLPNDIDRSFNDDLEAESLDQIDNNAIECLSNVTIAQSTNNNCSNDVTNSEIPNDDFTILQPPIEEPTTPDDFINPGDEQPIEPIPDPLVTEIPPSEPPPPMIGPDGLPIIIDDKGNVIPPRPPMIGPDGLPIIIDDKGNVIPPRPPMIGPDGLPIIIDDKGNVIPQPSPSIMDDKGKCCDNSISTPFNQLRVSWELKGDWEAEFLPFYKHPILCNLSDEMKFVFSWIKVNSDKIIDVAEKRKIDPVAIAGAIAWEALENVKDNPPGILNLWAGPGKVHYKCPCGKWDTGQWITNFDTTAEETEKAGYLPKKSQEDRRKILSTVSGSIEYIGAIMRADADAIAKGGHEINFDPVLLTLFYNAWDLEDIEKLAKIKKYPAELSFKDNPMANWVDKNIRYLQAALYEICKT